MQPPDGYPPFGPGYQYDPRNPALRNGRHADGRPNVLRLPFSAHGLETFTPPLFVPPLSCNTTLIVFVPLTFVARRNVSVPVGEMAG